MKTEILSLPIRQLRVKVIYGFGSFFRREAFNDIDLAVVLSESDYYELESYYALRMEIDNLGARLGVAFDLSIFTEEEFGTQPLRDMSQLVFLCGIDILSSLSSEGSATVVRRSD